MLPNSTLRRDRLHRNIIKRGQIIDSLRRRMKEQGFQALPGAGLYHAVVPQRCDCRGIEAQFLARQRV